MSIDAKVEAEDRLTILKRVKPKLYALFDFELNQRKGFSLEAFIQRAYELGVSYIQYRDKVNDLSTKEKILQDLRGLWDKILIVNDEPSLAKACDGLHLGQEDILKIAPDIEEGIEIIRSEIGDKIVGISTHNASEIKVANALPIDYIGLGAYRDSSTKKVSHLLGESIVDLIKLSKHPVAVIGGVRRDDEIEGAEFLVLGTHFYED